jgi:cell shape-determining protein MreC
MTKIYTLLIISLLVVDISCGTSSKISVGLDDGTSNGDSLNEIYIEIAQEKYGKRVSYKMNTNKTHVLCSTNITEANFTLVSFFIYDLTNEEVIYEPSKQFRKVTWISNKEIRADVMTGTPTGDGTNDYIIYNVEEKKEINSRTTKE